MVNRHTFMITLYILALMLAATVPWPMNIIQAIFCAVLLPIRIGLLIKDTIRERAKEDRQ